MSFMRIKNLALKLIIPVGAILFASILLWSQYSIRTEKKSLVSKTITHMDVFCNTVLKFTWFAMFHNPNQDMHDVLVSISEYNNIKTLRLYNTRGEIKFSNNRQEIHSIAKKTDEACFTCHNEKKPIIKHEINERIRLFKSDRGELMLGLINPILNEPGCSSAQCHYHSKEIKKLGTLDVVVSLNEVSHKIMATKKMFAWGALCLFLVLGATICLCIFLLVSRPIQQLIEKTELIGKGVYQDRAYKTVQNDEIGKLAIAIQDMGEKIQNKQNELNRQKDRYQELFDQVPCTITVQNKEFKLIEFNKEFSKKFQPAYGDHCFKAYKNLDEKCTNCPVERTFSDGQAHYSEESGIHKDGSPAHWFVKTAPLKDTQGNVVAAMEMSIDISKRKKLEAVAKDSEEKYQAIFQSIPNPVFLLDTRTYEILDCNDSARSVYGYQKGELKGLRFNQLFPENEQFEIFVQNIKTPFHERLTNCSKTREPIFVNIWVRSSEFFGQKVLLVTVIDITASVEAQQQLIQAGKMATLGEMATGVAHELNQPLSVIKTASSFMSGKIKKNEPIDPDILATLSQEIESHVDRASKITNHMRLFGRKSTMTKQDVDLNETLKRAFDIFSQQLKLRGIEVEWHLADDLPKVLADPLKLEQVFINILLNARDAIVAKVEVKKEAAHNAKRITICTIKEKNDVIVQISDTGTGMPKKIIDKIFEPFFTTKKVGKGTGLGLSISYGIIKESGGDIRVANNLDEGVTFTIRFKTHKEASNA